MAALRRNHYSTQKERMTAVVAKGCRYSKPSCQLTLQHEMGVPGLKQTQPRLTSPYRLLFQLPSGQYFCHTSRMNLSTTWHAPLREALLIHDRACYWNLGFMRLVQDAFGVMSQTKCWFVDRHCAGAFRKWMLKYHLCVSAGIGCRMGKNWVFTYKRQCRCHYLINFTMPLVSAVSYWPKVRRGSK